MSQPQERPGPSTEPSGDPAKGSKCRAPSWSGAEIKSLLELWGEEEALQALKSRRRNAEIYGRMAEALAQKGHYPRTQDQVRSKVKELRQGYAKAREESSRSGAAPHYCPYYPELDQILGGSAEARTPRRFVQSGLADPVVDAPERELQQSGDGDMVPEEEEEARRRRPSPPWSQSPRPLRPPRRHLAQERKQQPDQPWKRAAAPQPHLHLHLGDMGAADTGVSTRTSSDSTSRLCRSRTPSCDRGRRQRSAGMIGS
ncbi:zinc finger and SCAN domain-containing protein 20-like [Pelodiscus sinensis]|uniref:zinc finger and SCAN domain-containing protein 20-like n=1 Tax=Pelodiscus sinensis TaxID=13735 RepID=UPI003F6B8971